MTDAPRYGQRAPETRQEQCPRHPGVPAVSYCKRCNRPACADCSIPTEVGSICVDCAGATTGRKGRFASGGSPWGRPGARRGTSATASAVAPVTLTLIVINVVMFILQQFSSEVVNWLAFNPVFGYLQPWRLLTAAFVHGSFMHLLFNMLMLYLIGSSVEHALGWWRYLSVYLLSAVGGSMLIVGWVMVQPQSAATWTVGASGALYGLLAAILILQKRAGMSTTSILVLLAVNLIYSFTMSNVSWQAHVGGFLMGLLATAVFVWVADTFRSRGQKTLTGMSLVALGVLILLSVAGTWGLYALIS